MSKKKVVVALGHKALGATLPQQQDAVKGAAKAIARLLFPTVMPHRWV